MQASVCPMFNRRSMTHLPKENEERSPKLQRRVHDTPPSWGTWVELSIECLFMSVSWLVDDRRSATPKWDCRLFLTRDIGQEIWPSPPEQLLTLPHFSERGGASPIHLPDFVLGAS